MASPLVTRSSTDVLPPPVLGRETTETTGAAASPARPRRRGRRFLSADMLMFHLGLLCVCAAFLLPFVWMLSTSLKTLEQTSENPPRFTPAPWQPNNYVEVFRHPNFRMATYTRNTLIVAI